MQICMLGHHVLSLNVNSNTKIIIKYQLQYKVYLDTIDKFIKGKDAELRGKIDYI